MSTKAGGSDRQPTISQLDESERENPIGPSTNVLSQEIPIGVDRRTFLMRSAVVGPAAMIVGTPISVQERTGKSMAAPPKAPPGGTEVSPDLNVVKKQKGPVMTTLDEFYPLRFRWNWYLSRNPVGKAGTRNYY